MNIIPCSVNLRTRNALNIAAMEEDRSRFALVMAIWKRCKGLAPNLRFDFDGIFYRLGLSIGTKPWLWLVLSLCINCACGPGMLLWQEEDDDLELCMPVDSPVRIDAAWVKEHFRDDLRYESIIITAPNVLDPEVLRSIKDIENAVKSIVVNNHTWNNVCAGFLTWFEDGGMPSEDLNDVGFSEEILQNLNGTTLKDECIYQSLLKLWQNIIVKDVNNLTKTEVLNDVTAALQNKYQNHILHDVAPLLSGVDFDESGRVKSAKATILNWMLKKSNPHSAEWELEFIERVFDEERKLPPGMEVFAVATRSFKDFLHKILISNIPVLLCGITLIAIYVMTMIGRCNVIEQRVYLSFMGIAAIGQAMLSSYGVCYYMGYYYGPLHPVLPFLLIGIGVDDMFVIMQSLQNLSEDEKGLEIPLRIAKSLRQSGMSITVTSCTNLFAFGIGMTTVMPFLRSFCMFASMGVLFLYIFELTFFVSCLVYDEERLESRKDGCCCRPKPDWKSNECSRKNIQQTMFESYVGPAIVKIPVKIAIITITVVMACVNVWAIFQLEQNFDPLWYLNQESYPILFNQKLKEYFPKYGKRAGIYLTGVNYYEDRDSLFQLVNKLKTNPFINNRTLEPWFIAYERWLNQTYRGDIESIDEYYGMLTEYLLLTTEGPSYIKDIKFDKLPIGDYNITTSQIPIQHVLINTTWDQIRAMQSIREIVKTTNFSQGHDHIAIYSPDYVSWTANKIIGEELIRNLTVEILAIGLITIFLLKNLVASFWVICCIVLTLVDLLGSMYFLGLTIEISTSILVLLCVGLTVDYASHVGLEFIRSTGTKDERAIATLSTIGPAVFNGGLSTFLAFILLAFSKAYLLNIFFKLFTGVVIFGLFHGLLFLPIVMSLVGPSEGKKRRDKKEHVIQEHNGYYTVHLSSTTKDTENELDK